MLSKWRSFVVIAASIFFGTGPLLANPFSPKGKELGTPVNNVGRCGGPSGNFGRPEAYVKIVPGYPPGKLDQVQEFVGIDPSTQKYPAEFAWANRGQFGNGSPAWNEVCLGDQHHTLRKVGWENKIPVYCGNLVVEKNKYSGRLMPSRASEENLCDLRFVSSGLWIGDVFLDASRDMFWFPGDQPSLEKPGAVITESADLCLATEGVGMEPQILFYLKGYDKKGELIHVKFNAWSFRCGIKDNFAMYIGGRESFDPRLAVFPMLHKQQDPKPKASQVGNASQKSMSIDPNPSSTQVVPEERNNYGGIPLYNFGKPLGF